MAKEVITTLHPEDDITTDLYPNIKEDNIPSTFKEKISSEIANRTELIHKDASSSNTIVVGESDYALELVGTKVNARSKLNCSYITALNGDDLVLESKEGIVSVYGNFLVGNNGAFSTDRIEAYTGSDINVDARLVITDGLLTNTGTFDNYVLTDNINNTNGNAMVRYKSTENKVVLGGSTIPTTIMGSGDRPTYSKNGSDFTGNELALKSDVDTNWNLLMANLGVGRWANQYLYSFEWSKNVTFYDALLSKYTNYTRFLSWAKPWFPQYSTEQTDATLIFDSNFNSANCNYLLAFANCSFKTIKLSSMNIKNDYDNSAYMFANCPNLTHLLVKDGCEVNFNGKNMLNHTFYYSTKLQEIGPFNFQGSSFWSTFEGCSSLKTLHCKHWSSSFDIHYSTAFEEADLVEIISNLDTVTSTQILTMGATNLAKLTDEEKKVATDKGWILA